MSIWKNVHDKVVLGRLEEEALYEVALDQYESGARRRGLWAKALVEAEGDPAKTEAVYLRFLVAALRDELYVASRVHQQPLTSARSQVIEGRSSSPGVVPPHRSLQRAAHSAIEGGADIPTCEALIIAAGGTLENKGFLFGEHWLVTFAGKVVRIDRFEDLLRWVQGNLPLQQWSSGQS